MTSCSSTSLLRDRCKARRGDELEENYVKRRSEELRSEIANADVLMTTWHSPFLTAEMLGQKPRVKLIAHCGGEVSRVWRRRFSNS